MICWDDLELILLAAPQRKHADAAVVTARAALRLHVKNRSKDRKREKTAVKISGDSTIIIMADKRQKRDGW